MAAAMLHTILENSLININHLDTTRGFELCIFNVSPRLESLTKCLQIGWLASKAVVNLIFQL